MGLSLNIQNLIKRIVQHQKLSGAALMYGVQKMPYEQNITSYKFLQDLGFPIVHSIDVYNKEKPTYVANMDFPVDLPIQYDCIIDGGTIEHCFNTPSVLSNGVRFLKPRGVIMHFTPMNNWMGHGFYQFSPGLFYDFYYDNHFTDLNAWLLRQASGEIIPITVSERHRDFKKYEGETMITFACKKGKKEFPIEFPIQSKYRKPRRDWKSRKDVDNWSKEI